MINETMQNITLKYLSIFIIAILIIACKNRASDKNNNNQNDSTQIDNNKGTLLYQQHLIDSTKASALLSQEKYFHRAFPETTYYPIKSTSLSKDETLKISQTVLEDTSNNSTGLTYYQIFKIFKVDTLTPTQTITDSGNYCHDYEFIDIDSDGYNDLKIECDPYDLRLPSNYWIYNRKSRLFEYCDILSGLSELSSNNGVFSTQDLSTGGKGGYYSKFIIQDGQPKEIETVYSNFFNYEKKILVNGELAVVEQDEDDLKGALDGDIHTITSKRIVYDSLRIVEKCVLKDLDNKNISDDIEPTVLRSEPFGNFIYLEDITFEYKYRSNGVLQIEKTTRRVVKNKWVTIKKEIID